MDIRAVIDWIILIGALVLAITNIINFVRKPSEKYKEKKEQELNEAIDTAIDKKLPDLLYKHDLETRDKYLNDRLKYLQDIKGAVLEEIEDSFKNVQEKSEIHSDTLSILVQTSKDVLRQRIMTIYHNYKKERSFPIYEREALDELYKDYKAQGGNSYIDKYYKRMSTWTTLEDEDYID